MRRLLVVVAGLALRAGGEAHHEAGRHSESMAALGEARKLLGI